MTLRQERSFESAIREFDFDRVRKTMEVLDWKWAPMDRVPSVGDMFYMVRYLAETKREVGTTGTGGFEVEWDGEEYTIRFVLEEVTGYVDGE